VSLSSRRGRATAGRERRAGFLCVVVERAKKCLDFTATLYIVHLFICLVHSGMPSNVEWWVLNFTGLITMAVIGYVVVAPKALLALHRPLPAGQSIRCPRYRERQCGILRPHTVYSSCARGGGRGRRSEWLCMRREMRDIPLPSTTTRSKGRTAQAAKGVAAGAHRRCCERPRSCVCRLRVRLS